ncbi:MAG: nucleotidyltransferase domain-containing protein [Gemmatimonadota bacterium]|nr:nucleotidyltransferase domain-containing protein [Gemmatimonadota bacterium]
MATSEAGVIDALKHHFAIHHDGIVAAYLFGSHGRGEAGPESDVDIGLLFREAPAPSLGGPVEVVEAELEQGLERPVEAVLLNTAPADLVHRVLRDGVLVFEGDRSARIRFEISARREYFDLLPVLRRYRRPAASAG